MHDVNAQPSRLHPKNSVIFTQDAAATSPLVIDEGVARLCIYLPDGQRIVAGFAFPGEVVGLARPRHSVTVEAVTSTWTHEWTHDGNDVAVQETQMLAKALSRATTALAVRSRHQAHARVAAFLLELADRGFGSSFALPISRADLGDHLGITVHTISRILSDFRRSGLIEQSPGRVITINQPALAAVANEGRQISQAHSVSLISEMVH